MGAPFGQDHVTMAPGPYTYQPLGYAQLAVTGTAQTLPQMLAAGFAAGTSKLSAVPIAARTVLVLAETANVRYIDDGQVPMPGFGFLLTNGQEIAYSGNLSAIQFVADSGSPIIDVSFMK
jgi:hypothetical protein